MPAKKKAKGFNLATLDTFQNSVSGVDLIIKNPFDENKPIGDKGSYLSLKVLGPASRQYREVQTKILREMMVKKKDGEGELESSDFVKDQNYERQNIEIIVACVIGWNNMYFDPNSGDDTNVLLDFNKDNLEMVLVHLPWICNQIQAFILNERNFMRA